jgi:hypothetical protein
VRWRGDPTTRGRRCGRLGAGGEAKRYDYSVDLFCRVPDCLNAPGQHGLCTEHTAQDTATLPTPLTWIDPDTAARVAADAPPAAETVSITVFVTHNHLHISDGKPPRTLWPSMQRGGVGLIRPRPPRVFSCSGFAEGVQVSLSPTLAPSVAS